MADAITPVYLAYTTFKSTIQNLGLNGVFPSRVDHSVLNTLSGSGRKMFLAALRFFELIDETGIPTDRLKRLSVAKESEWKDYVGVLLKEKYNKQVEELTNATPKALRESFEEAFPGIGSSLITPSVRFLVSAARDAGFQVSHHLGQRQVPASASPKRRTKKSPKQDPNINMRTDSQQIESPPDFATSMLQKFPSFDPSWSPDQQKSWFSAYEKLLVISKPANGND